ncbi:MAG TPA: T9SS type A sorting domain-containing protein, partial [Bacteroidia bacterium]|nr:T9SS type A sorting domain-containing protein [Bacteroidia bacterium]
VDVCTGIRSSKLDELVSIYPNPAHGKVKIEYVSEGVVQSLELFNATGSIIYFQNIKENYPTNTFEIDLSSYPSGVYLIRLQTNNGAIFKKLMLE